MTRPHQKKPSDLPYRATRWIDLGRMVCDAFTEGQESVK